MRKYFATNYQNNLYKRLVNAPTQSDEAQEYRDLIAITFCRNVFVNYGGINIFLHPVYSLRCYHRK